MLYNMANFNASYTTYLIFERERNVCMCVRVCVYVCVWSIKYIINLCKRHWTVAILLQHTVMPLQNENSALIVYKFKQIYSIIESKLQYISEITHIMQNKLYPQILKCICNTQHQFEAILFFKKKLLLWYTHVGWRNAC